jgi:multidrug resistance efflux pump
VHQVSLPLRDLPFAEERVAQGEVLVRLDPVGAPPATGASEEELALAALAALEGTPDEGREAMEAAFQASKSAEELERDAEEKEQVHAGENITLTCNQLLRSLLHAHLRCAFN